MGRKRDRFWEFAEELNGRFKCKFCELVFAGGASRIKCHLAGAKGHDISICTKVPKAVQEEASLAIGMPNKKLKGASTSNEDKEREIKLLEGKRNMGRKRDRFWEFAEEINGRFKCKFCELDFAGGASRIKSHLAGVKGHAISICTKVPKEVQEEASLAVGMPNKKLKGASTSNEDMEREIKPTSISKDDMFSGVFEKRKAEEILLGVFVEVLLARLRSMVIEQHVSFELGFMEGLIDLLMLLTQIQLVLNDAEKRQASDDFVRSWLAELRPVAYDIDNVLGKFGYNILQLKVLNYSSPSKDNINMANKIKTINESLKRLKGDIASYQAAFENSIPVISWEMDPVLDEEKLWKMYWAWNEPPKVKTFIWRACSNMLPTRMNLQQQKVQVDQRCELCCQQPETCAHFLWECPFARNVWAMMRGRVQKCSNGVQDFFQLFRIGGDKRSKGELEQWAVLSWAIWNARNKLYFEKVQTHPKLIMEGA
ncbi:uncharacterized protein LOC115965822 [Quercus lobata]|uniref:BED-type domain-containing protein n=1 Tax=Quercus lobata TaxID=97700 RepID=A0A7N2MTH8_QUELO|nr:uncharacterized protein LOC115965434 [Quercus lobata]XP_030940976.1 uncharacterized protein LOC115965822 [Quercus lobata]